MTFQNSVGRVQTQAKDLEPVGTKISSHKAMLMKAHANKEPQYLRLSVRLKKNKFHSSTKCILKQEIFISDSDTYFSLVKKINDMS